MPGPRFSRRWDLEGSARRDAAFVAWIEEHAIEQDGRRVFAAPVAPDRFGPGSLYGPLTVRQEGERTIWSAEAHGCIVQAVSIDGELRPMMTPEREARELREAAAYARQEADRLEAVAAKLEES